MEQRIDLLDFRHCNDIYTELDYNNSASTYLYQTNMSEIISKETSKYFKQHISDVLAMIYGHVIKNNFTIECSSEDKTNFGEEVWGIYSVYKHILCKQEKILFPIVASLLPNNKFVVHPGTKRLLIAEYYRKPVTVLLTDYTKQYSTNIEKLRPHFDHKSKDMKLLLKVYDEKQIIYPKVKAYSDKLEHYELYSHMTRKNKDWQYTYEFKLEKEKYRILFNGEPFLINKNNYITFDL